MCIHMIKVTRNSRRVKEGNKVAVNLMEDCEGGVGYSCCQLLLIVTFVTIEDSHPVED